MRTLFLLLTTISLAFAQDADFFEKKIRPIFATECQGCHGAKMQMAGLDLSTAAGFAKGSDKGAIISKDAPDKSRLLAVLSYTGKVKMPPTGRLRVQQFSDVLEWVKAGAAWPKDAATTAKPGWTKADQSFWSFQPVKRQSPPEVKNTAWVKNEIDRFILAKLEENGLGPAPPAAKITLLRRATFDLTGLAPTPGEVDSFVADNSPNAFEKVIDRLLASPRYGEKWGRHWLDVARYADSTGADEDHRYPHAWRYRDYVIDAFNRDLPYNQFVTEQVAGDLLPSGKPGEPNIRGTVATGFLVLGPRLIAEQDKPKMLYDFIDEQIDVTSRAFLGLTLACARCHDHKFDPLPQKDYYSMAAIFANSKAFSKIGTGGVSEMYYAPLVPDTEWNRYEAYQNRVKAKQREIDGLLLEEQSKYTAKYRDHIAEYLLAAAGVGGAGLDQAVVEKWKTYLADTKGRPHLDEWAGATSATREAVARHYQQQYSETAKKWDATLAEWRPKSATAEVPRFNANDDRFFDEVTFGKGPFGLPKKERDKHVSAESLAALKNLKHELHDLKLWALAEPPMAVAITEGTPVKQHVFLRGNVGNNGDEVQPRFPLVLAGYQQPAIAKGSGRLELAKWLTDPSHPLTSRVMVNRMWEWHFVNGVVRTASNYGLLGERPTHPELLDFLAAKFIDMGWSVKHMHKYMMLSAAYQMSSEITKDKAEKDADNKLFSRYPRRRLDVEEIRDTMLAFDGALDLTMGGTLQSGEGTDGENDARRLSIDPATVRRRTVYLPLRRSNLPTLLNLFDFGDATTSSEGRSNTNVAPQALFMMNSPFINERAKSLAATLLKDARLDDSARIVAAYRTVLVRRPETDEVESALDYLAGFTRRKDREEAWTSLCRILIGSNEFIYVD